jgi:hypothetical protein
MFNIVASPSNTKGILGLSGGGDAAGTKIRTASAAGKKSGRWTKIRTVQAKLSNLFEPTNLVWILLDIVQ